MSTPSPESYTNAVPTLSRHFRAVLVPRAHGSEVLTFLRQRGVGVTPDTVSLADTHILTLGPATDLDAIEALLREWQPAAAGNADKARGPDARRSKRRAPKGSTKTHCYASAMGLGRNIAASVLDLSETGARLLFKAEVRVGQEVEINLDGSFGATVKQVAVVVWVTPQKGDLFLAGCRFEKSIPHTALLGLSRM